MSTERRPATGNLARGFSEILAAKVLERLAELDLIAAGERRSVADVERIRRDMRQAISMWRSLLEQHRADDDTRCPRCRTWWGRRRRWPCPIWNAAHTSLLIHDPPKRQTAPPPSDRARQPGQPPRPAGSQITPDWLVEE